jgi:hypothetical protein
MAGGSCCEHHKTLREKDTPLLRGWEEIFRSGAAKALKMREKECDLAP